MPKRVALFVPCYVDQFYPQVARATLELLARLKSRDDEGFSERLLAALRHRFGGHAAERADLQYE